MPSNSLIRKDRAHCLFPLVPNGGGFRACADGVIGLAPPICIIEAEADLLVCRLRATLDTLLDIQG